MSRSRRQSTTKSPQAKRRQRSAKVAIRRGSTLNQSLVPRRIENRMAPPKYTERRSAKPGAGIKRSKANMAPRSR